MTVIFLDGILPNGIHFKKPGAIHHGRWMAKAIYSLKIYLFREQFRLTVKEETALRNICIFIIRLYIKSRFYVPSAIKAPFQDLTFIKNLLNYIAIKTHLRLQLKSSVVTCGICQQNYVNLLFLMRLFRLID